MGSEITRFAIPIWLLQQGAGVTSVSLAAAAEFIPKFLVGPIAGAINDKYDRKKIMLLADAGQAVLSLILLIMLHFFPVAVRYYMYVFIFAGSSLTMFQLPAVQASVGLLVDRKAIASAHGWLTFVEGFGNLLGPLIGGAVLQLMTIEWIVAADFISFILSLAILAGLRPLLPVGAHPKISLNPFSQFMNSIRLIGSFAGIVPLLVITTCFNFFTSFAFVLLMPMVLATNLDQTFKMGLVNMSGGVGQLAGGFIAGILPFQEKLINKVLLSGILAGLLGFGTIAAGSTWPVWMLGFLIFSLLIPIINSSNRTIWSLNFKDNEIGKAFAARRSISAMGSVLGFLAAGPVVDYLAPALIGGEKTMIYRAAFLFASLGITVSFVIGYFLPSLHELQSKMDNGT